MSPPVWASVPSLSSLILLIPCIATCVPMTSFSEHGYASEEPLSVSAGVSALSYNKHVVTVEWTQGTQTTTNPTYQTSVNPKYREDALGKSNISDKVEHLVTSFSSWKATLTARDTCSKVLLVTIKCHCEAQIRTKQTTTTMLNLLIMCNFLMPLTCYFFLL